MLRNHLRNLANNDFYIMPIIAKLICVCSYVYLLVTYHSSKKLPLGVFLVLGIALTQ